MEQLLRDQRPDEKIELYRSVEFGLLVPEERRQFFWLFVGILTCRLSQSLNCFVGVAIAEGLGQDTRLKSTLWKRLLV